MAVIQPLPVDRRIRLGIVGCGGVCFDMDGTLIDSEPVWTRAIASCCAAAGLVLTPDLLNACAGLDTAEGICLVLRRNPGRDVDPARLGEAIKNEVGARLRRDPPVMPGADALLRELHRRGVPMALVSSSPRILIRSVLDGLAWEPLFRLSLSTEEVGPGKPDPAVYAEALRLCDRILELQPGGSLRELDLTDRGALLLGWVSTIMADWQE